MILAVLQARMSSNRLPGKVLKPLCGAPSLQRQVERLRRARCLDDLVVATSTEPDDSAIAEHCAQMGVEVHRGPLDNVLERFYGAAQPKNPSHVVRLTADCPLAEPEIIDRLVRLHLEGGYDYSSNALQRSYPVGLDAEIMTFEVLDVARREAKAPAELEHVTPYIYRSDRFRMGSLRQEMDLSRVRWTLDTPQDYAFLSKVYEALFPGDATFSAEDILNFLRDRPEIWQLNADEEAAQQYRLFFARRT